MNYPEYALIEDRKYKINTDLKYALKCYEVINDSSISDYERAEAIVYILFGEEGLNSNDKNELLKKAQLYLQCGQKENIDNDIEPDMDFIEDYDYIVASFMSDFQIDLDNTKLHWWKFNKLMNGLSNSELGDCCILNRIRNLRNYDVKDITDAKEREKIIKANL